MKKKTIYELLGLIKDNKAPKVILAYSYVWNFDDVINDYIRDDSITLFGDYLNFAIPLSLKDKVEILDDDYLKEEKEHRKKLLNRLAKNYDLEVVDILKDSDSNE